MNKPASDKQMNTAAVIDLIRQGYDLEELSRKVRMPSLPDCLNEMMEKRNLSVAVTAGKADVNETTLYNIMAQRKAPSRNLLIRIAFALEMSLDETQVLLKSGNCAALSGLRKRDVFILAGIISKKTFDEVDDTLKENGFPGLYSRG